MDLQPLESGNAVLQTVQSSEGGRAFKLLQERQRRLKGLEAAKTEIEKETQRRRLCHIDEKYTGSTSEALEAAFREETVGLVTAEEFRAKRLRLLQKLEDELAAAQVVATKPCATYASCADDAKNSLTLCAFQGGSNRVCEAASSAKVKIIFCRSGK